LDFLKYPYHQPIVSHGIGLSVGGGIGQSGTMMQILHKAHPGEVSGTMWPKVVLKEMCGNQNINALN
jgi:aspartate--ammonia ligase